MFLGEGLFGLALVALWAYCIFDVIRTDDSLVQNLPKMFWLMIVIFLPEIGSIAWLLLGRPSGGRWELREPRTSRPPIQTRPTGLPETTTRPSAAEHEAKREEALRRYNLERETELRKREEDLARREEELLRKNRPQDDQPD